MIHRIARGRIPDKPHTVFEPDGALFYELCFTRRGFEGAHTILYHRKPPHWIDSEKDLGPHPGLSPDAPGGALHRSHYRAADTPAGGTPFLGRKLLLANSDCGLWISRPDRSEESLVSNADADELTFVHEGSGQVHSPLGILRFEKGDYVYVPRGLAHRFVLDAPALFLLIEGRSFVDIPAQFRNPAGQLRMDAPYSHRDFRVPEWPEGGIESVAAPRGLVVQRGGRLTSFEMSHNPFDVAGWDGFVWPFAFPILSYQAKTGLVHLPPTIHTTFAGGGFVVCSFVPRMVDTHERAIPCPYPHTSVDCDEAIFYVDGSFTSRKGIAPGSITLHPTGLPHGPHPGTYEASIGSRRTSELAVMIDTFRPLVPTAAAIALEDSGYNRSWSGADPAAAPDTP